LSPSSNIILSPYVKNCEVIEHQMPVRNLRYPFFNAKGLFGKTFNLFILNLYALYMLLRCRPLAIHAGQILSSGVIGFLLKKIFKVPYFLWVYGGETSDAYTKSKLLFSLMERIISAADKIITNSPYVTNEFKEFGLSESRIVEILPAVNNTTFVPRSGPDLLALKQFVSGKKVLLTVARLTPRKGHDLVLKALKELLKKYPDLVYLIVGNGVDEKRLRAMAHELSIHENVHFAGYVDDEVLPSFYNLCDIYVMPNREDLNTTDSVEGFGISFIEASACGKPVIGGRSGGAGAAVVDGKTGYLVNPFDHHELESKIMYLIERPDLCRQMGKNGRSRVENDFTWQQRSEKIEALHNNYASTH